MIKSLVQSVQSTLKLYSLSLVVPDALISGICQGEVDEAYLGHLQMLDAKLRFVRSKDAVGGSAAV